MSIINRFCQYFWVSESRWETCKDLHHNFQKYRQKHTDFAALCDREQPDDRAIVQFWLDVALKDLPTPQPWEPQNRQQLALRHLSAFLQETCRQVAKKFASQYRNFLSINCDLEVEAFDITIDFTSFSNPKFRHALTNYDPDRSRLETYFVGTLKNILRDRLKMGKNSNEKLLYKASEKKLRNALQGLGEQEPRISWIVFAHSFFKKVYGYKGWDPSRKNKKYPKIELEDYLEVSQYYNAYRKLEMAPRLVFNSNESITENTIQEWFQLAIEALRMSENKFQIQALEYRDPITGGEEEVFELEEEEQCLFLPQVEQCHAEVLQAIQSNRIPKSHLAIPFLSYGLRLPQEKVAQRCSIDQGTVSRHLSNYYEKSLQEKLERDYKTLNRPQYLSSWLFKSSIPKIWTPKVVRALDNAYKQLSLKDRTVLTVCDGSLSFVRQVALELSWTESEVKQRLEQLNATLEDVLHKAIQKNSKGEFKKTLRKAYQSQIAQILMDALHRLDVPYRDCTIARYVSCMEIRRIAEFQNLSFDRVEEVLWEAQLKLRHEMVGWMQEHLGVALDAEEEFLELEQAIQSWLDRLYEQQLR
jgi:RNA polymerase sigma factor (sigma-70 family)